MSEYKLFSSDSQVTDKPSRQSDENKDPTSIISVHNLSLDNCNDHHDKITDKKIQDSYDKDSYFEKYEIVSRFNEEKSNFKRLKEWFDDMVRLHINVLLISVYFSYYLNKSL